MFDFLPLVFIYFIPAIIALSREHRSGWAIFALNLLTGWTGLGWIISIVWALTNPGVVVVEKN